MDRLKQLPSYAFIPLGNPHSFRGYYRDLACEQVSTVTYTVGAFFKTVYNKMCKANV